MDTNFATINNSIQFHSLIDDASLLLFDKNENTSIAQSHDNMS